ncbi:unnamed protein product [Cyprideis torosa]|uniref:Uncharacterized protein n=1 Tax=Cyprideis torosa TaxID=163714 RepID=A0A7R8WX13_9CRUS|nr:unnamed protein product [Cyprideis torosa]CAG0908336.1 unnamed protein product [Cyprideis torosa]
MQVHVCPIPKAVGEVFTDLFIEEAAQVGCEMIPLPKHTDIRQLAPPGAAYFLIESPTGEKLYLKLRRMSSEQPPMKLSELQISDSVRRCKTDDVLVESVGEVLRIASRKRVTESLIDKTPPENRRNRIDDVDDHLDEAGPLASQTLRDGSSALGATSSIRDTNT